MNTTRRHLPTAAISCLVVLATACGTTVSSAPSDDTGAAPDPEATPAPAADVSAAPAEPPPAPADAPAPASPADDSNGEPEPEPAPEPEPPSTGPEPPTTDEPEPPSTGPEPPTTDEPEPPSTGPEPTTTDEPEGSADAGDLPPLPPIDENGDFVLVESVDLSIGPIAPKPGAHDAPDCGLVSNAPIQPGTITAWSLDVLGDGTADDVVNVFYDGAWRVRLLASNGAVSEYLLPDPGDEHPAVLGDVRLEGGDSEDILVTITSDDDHHLLGLFGATDDGCLFRYTYASGYEVVLSVRETPDLQEGVWCAASVGQYRAERRANGNWDHVMTSLARTGPSTLDWTPGWGGDDVPASDLNPVGFDCLGHTL